MHTIKSYPHLKLVCINKKANTCSQMSFICCTFVHTMYVFDYIDAEAMSGDCGEHLPCTPPPRQVMGGAPGGDGTEQQLEVILLGQLLRGRHKCAKLHQDLQKERTRHWLQQTVWTWKWAGKKILLEKNIYCQAPVFHHGNRRVCRFGSRFVVLGNL